MWRVEVAETCIGSGVCAGTAPKHFTLGDDNRSHPASGPVGPEESILDAAASCPVEAIRVVDTESGAEIEP